MDPREMDSLVERLIQNPHDQDALTHAHQAGQSDPRSYAMLLEKVGTSSSEPAVASHWLTEAANVWANTLSDAHRAARALMIAIDRDPTQALPAERLAELYREKSDSKALVALLERRAKALAPLAREDAEVRAQLAVVHEELGRLWSEAPLSQTRKAMEHYKRAIECDSRSQYAIYALREIYKSLGQWAEAIPYFELEQQLIADDPERQLALYQDESEVRKNAGDLAGAAAVLRSALLRDGGRDPGLKQLLASAVLERVQAGESLHESELVEAAQLFNELAEQFPGEYGYSYAMCGLEVDPGNDRALQLAVFYARELDCEEDVALRAAAYLKVNPQGALAAEAHALAERHLRDGPGELPAAALEPVKIADTSGRVRSLLESAEALARRGKKNEAAATYKTVLEIDAIQPEALGFLETHLRQARKYAELRDVLLAASRHPGADVEVRVAWLREIAGLCEAQLRDIEGAISAWQQLVGLQPDDEPARGQLRRLLERAGKWDDLSALLERDAEQEPDPATRIALEKALAKIHEQKRRDPVATGEVWARIARLSPGDEATLWTAVRHFEKGQRLDLAAHALAENAPAVKEERTRIQLFKKLGELRERSGEPLAAGEAFVEAAQLSKELAAWEAAEQCFVAAEAWEQAASAIGERAKLVPKPKERALLYAREAEYLTRANHDSSALLRLEQATELDPTQAEYAEELEARYTRAGRLADLAAFLQKRAGKLSNVADRVELRKRAAALLRDSLNDPDGARECLRQLVSEHDDAAALAELAADAEQRERYEEARDYLRRLSDLISEKTERAELLLREARIVAEKLGDARGGIERYEEVLRTCDPTSLVALAAIAELCEREHDPEGTAHALERRLQIVQELDVAQKLADLYENELGRPADAVRVLDVVRELDDEDYEAIERSCRLCEQLEDWPRVAELLAALIDVEADDVEVSRMTRRLAEILHEKLGKNDEALAVLLEVGDRGDEQARAEYVRLGDALGWKGIVATKLIDWYADAPASKERYEALRGAFARFIEVGREAEAVGVAKELARVRTTDPEFAHELERVAVRLKDLDALAIAHDLLVQELSGPTRAEEMVRQAEVLLEVGVAPEEALQHGEQALTSAAPGDVEPLLARLSQLATGAAQIIGLYERQISRCKAPADRLHALARAAEVAAECAELDRAAGFFALALGGGVQQEALNVLEAAAAKADAERSDHALTRTLARAMAEGGQGLRDGGRTQSALLRRAAKLAYERLGDVELAFRWLGDALVAHVDEAGLDALERLAEAIGEPQRIEIVLTRALADVFDGPLVRKLLARRASTRQKQLGDMAGAAQDLKKLHDLSPSDTAVMDQLSELYTELADYRGMVQLYEDQILRGRDPAARAELARKVARLWEEELDDPREAADAWRRVLRMKSADPEATAGLERAKALMLSRSAAKSEPVAAAPPKPRASAPHNGALPKARPKGREPRSAPRGVPDLPDDSFPEEDEVTKIASMEELEARSLASSPRPVQLTPVPDSRDDALTVDENELLDE